MTPMRGLRLQITMTCYRYLTENGQNRGEAND
jgi:hypothetical protein